MVECGAATGGPRPPVVNCCPLLAFGEWLLMMRRCVGTCFTVLGWGRGAFLGVVLLLLQA